LRLPISPKTYPFPIPWGDLDPRIHPSLGPLDTRATIPIDIKKILDSVSRFSRIHGRYQQAVCASDYWWVCCAWRLLVISELS